MHSIHKKIAHGLVSLISGIFCFHHPTFALYEIGATANYRKSLVDSNNFQESLSYTASLSYYFWEMSAIELSYTSGISRLVIKPIEDSPKNTTTITFELLGADFVLSLAEREDILQPYIKLGAAHIRKEIRRSIEGGATTSLGTQEGLVPSGGLGLKIMLDQSFSIKVGLDAWTSPVEEDDFTVDYAGRAGVSWMF